MSRRQLTFIDLFSGIGGFRLGMELAGHKCLGHCEIDKFANKSYAAMHKPREDEWFGEDITAVRADELPRADVWCFGFPCQDISIAGRQNGFRGKRSSLFFTVTELIRELKEEDRPQYLFIENVKNLLSINRGFDFAKLQIELDELGYDTEWQVLNSKNFGVPQNRERVFIIGHHRGRSGGKVFPIAPESYGTLKQIVGGMQGLRVYDSSGVSSTLIGNGGGAGGKTGLYTINEPCFIDLNKNPKLTEEARCLKARYNAGITNRGCDNSGVAIPVLTPDRVNKRQNGRRFKEDGEPMFTLTAQDRHGVMIKEATKKGYAIAYEGDSINLERPNSKTRRGRVGKGVAQTLTTSCNQAVLRPVRTEYGKSIRKAYENGEIEEQRKNMTQLEPREDGLSNTLTTVQKDNMLLDGIRIRRLTPRECFRLQGFPDEYFERAAAVNSDAQLYKQAGNGVTVNVVYAIGKKISEI